MTLKKVFVVIIPFLLLAACGGGGAPRLSLGTPSLELGDVPNGLVVERAVAVRNNGDAPLVVESVITSCGCTTAALEPETIASGESGTLTITFDSGAHGPELRGLLTREVTLVSNDPGLPEAVVTVRANVVSP